MNTKTEAILAFFFIVGAALAKPPSTTPTEKEKTEPADKWLSVQVFLDNTGFKPGMIDGKWGEFTGKALARYQRAQGNEAQAQTANEQPRTDQLDLPTLFNEPLVSGMINYLGEDDALVSIPPKDENTEQAFLMPGQLTLFGWIHLGYFPLLALALAILVYLKRR